MNEYVEKLKRNYLYLYLKLNAFPKGDLQASLPTDKIHNEMPVAEKVMDGTLLPRSERVMDDISADATMDELEADIQRRLNLIKESLAKLDAPLTETSSKKGDH